ncbi:RidA family protein [Thermaerobacter subterraneus]|uniref:Translation initiation inhibitor, yjgF family n=1 Tax=Thermaerobacter subterraneus DSM 13965 TaxID=867903 RepID=K6PZ74_9FIRM|nr:RidA family protein [Thermaerobacter subterraneus]EKP93879.1 putative translation initiation inhibitor, yjgF family [Thermaerobacter subterraneus DSM 13965]
MSFERRLEELGLQLPPVAPPVAAYVPGVLQDGWLYVSGQLPLKEGQVVYRGKVGREVSPEDGYQAARLCALNILAVVRSITGSLDRVRQVVKVVGFVNSAPGFAGQPQVVNGASELLGQVFGEQGRHARSAVGVAELPLDAAVEVEAIFRVEG